MHRQIFDISKSELQRLLVTMTLRGIADKLNVDVRSVRRVADRYGLKSTFANRQSTPEEVDAIRQLLDEGKSVKAIAEKLQRSQNFVGNRVIEIRQGRPAPTSRQGTPISAPDRPTERPEDKLRGIVYGVPRPADNTPLVGARFCRHDISASQAGNGSAMCADAL